MNIRKKIAISFGIPMGILLFLMGIVIFTQANRTVVPLTKRLASSIVDARSSEINQWIAGIGNEVQSISNEKIIRSGNVDDIRDYLLYKKDFLDDDFLLMWFADLNGDFFTTTGNSGNIRQREDLVALFDNDEKSYISNPMISEVTNEPIIVVAYPVNGMDGKLIGALAGVIDISTITEVASQSSIGGSSFGFVVDGNGLVIAHPDENIRLDLNLSDSNDSRNASLGGLYTAIKSNPSGDVTYKDLTDTKSTVLFTKIKNTPDWTLAIKIPTKELTQSSDSILRFIIICTVVILLTLIGVVQYVSNRISKPIVQNVAFAKNIAGLDISEDMDPELLTRSDEIGELSNSLYSITLSFREFMKVLKNSSNIIAGSSFALSNNISDTSKVTEDIANTIEQIAEGANSQAENTENGFTRTSTLSDFMDDQTEDLKQVSDSSKKILVLKENIETIISRLINQGRDNSNSIEAVQDGIIHTNESTYTIKEATKLIKDIARQTNLLALNASIEAARAGEYGLGFSVVANEIGTLAEESTKFADNIDSIVMELNKSSNEDVETIKEIAKINADLVESISSTNDIFLDMSDEINQSGDAIFCINTKTFDMVKEKNDILSIIENLSAIAQENAASTEEVSASIEETSASLEEIAQSSQNIVKVANDLDNIINKFKM